MAMTDDAPAPGRAADIEPFWLAYQRACQVKVPGFSASALGHTRALADTLAALVVAGVKRAQATPLRDFETDDADPGEAREAGLPQPGDHLVVLDGGGAPCAIVRTTHVEKRLFNQIDDAFAFEAGEGDLSLRWWLTAHRQDYAERAEAEGFAVDERLELLLEYFEMVWPPVVAAGAGVVAVTAVAVPAAAGPAGGLSSPA
jgi:uncharacterized protein YhfF